MTDRANAVVRNGKIPRQSPHKVVDTGEIVGVPRLPEDRLELTRELDLVALPLVDREGVVVELSRCKLLDRLPHVVQVGHLDEGNLRGKVIAVEGEDLDLETVGLSDSREIGHED